RPAANRSTARRGERFSTSKSARHTSQRSEAGSARHRSAAVGTRRNAPRRDARRAATAAPRGRAAVPRRSRPPRRPAAPGTLAGARPAQHGTGPADRRRRLLAQRLVGALTPYHSPLTTHRLRLGLGPIREGIAGARPEH